MESQNQEFALSGSKNKYTRTDTDFFFTIICGPHWGGDPCEHDFHKYELFEKRFHK